MSLRTFAGEVLADFQTTAAIAPSSNSLVQAMLEPLPLRTAKVVVELGPGTGVMTRALLDRMPQNAVLLAFEINPRFFRYLSETSSDPRLRLINAGAETLAEELRRRGTKRVDAVVSSLGLSLMPDQQRHAILGGLLPFMGPQSVFTQFLYIHAAAYYRVENGRPSRFNGEQLLRRYFNTVQRRSVWLNLPPAFAFACRP